MAMMAVHRSGFLWRTIERISMSPRMPAAGCAIALWKDWVLEVIATRADRYSRHKNQKRV
jgi:hypothetical protein